MSAAAEIRRLRYLSAMGVQALVSRRALPGAAPSRKLMLRAGPARAELEPGRTAAATPAGAKSAADAPPAALVGLRKTLATPTASAAAPRPAPGSMAPSDTSESRPPSPVGPATRFRLAAIVCAQRLWVEDLGDDALATEQLQLVSAIARALVQVGETPAAPQVTQFDWPLHGNAQLDLGADEAAATLASFLQRQLDENACVEVMCLGPAAARRLAGLKLPCALRRLPSTRELLEAPLRKRDLWLELRT